MEHPNEVFDLVFAKNEGEFTKRAIFTCSPTIRSLIMKEECVYIDCSKCICSDNLFIHQCLYCAGFGHTEKFCNNKSSWQVLCTFCANYHRISECPHKNNRNKQCCANCLKSSNRDVSEDAISHSASNKDCPIFKQELTKLTLRTDYGCDFVHM